MPLTELRDFRYQLGRWGSEYSHWAHKREYIIEGACVTYRRPWWFLRLLGWHVIDKQEKVTP